jgi:hypothetical protein
MVRVLDLGVALEMYGVGCRTGVASTHFHPGLALFVACREPNLVPWMGCFACTEYYVYMEYASMSICTEYSVCVVCMCGMYVWYVCVVCMCGMYVFACVCIMCLCVYYHVSKYLGM